MRGNHTGIVTNRYRVNAFLKPMLTQVQKHMREIYSDNPHVPGAVYMHLELSQH